MEKMKIVKMRRKMRTTKNKDGSEEDDEKGNGLDEK